MNSIKLTKKEARWFILSHQYLLPPYQVSGKDGIIDYIGRVGCIQFDPLSIVGNNPELVLQSRVTGFRPGLLQELLYKDRKLLDGWDKMMAIYRTEDWPYFHYRQQEAAKRSSRRDSNEVKAIFPQIRKAIEERGPLSSINLDHNRKVDWWWGPTRLAKVALDDMYYLGELIIHHKVHTRKVYDFASRHIPEELLSSPDPHETREQYHDWHVLRRLGGIGLLWRRVGVWQGIHGARSKERMAALMRLINQGQVVKVSVENIKFSFYMRSCDLSVLDTVTESDDVLKQAAIIAPLDNLMWDRELIQALFDFKYRWEVYKPVDERKYGYYVLPVLYGDRFVARFEPEREKKSGALVIKNWWWELGVTQTAEMRAGLRDCFKRFLSYLGTDLMTIDRILVKREELGWIL